MTADYWIVGARVVDGTGQDPAEGVAIHVVDGRIADLGQAPPDAETLDAGGLTITPGLIDAHVHFGLSSEITPSLRRELSVAELAADMFANCSSTLDAGFTTVRDTGGIDAGLARAVASGKVRGPRILQCGPVQCQTGGHGHLAAEWEPTSDWGDHAIPGLRAMSLLSDGPAEMRKNIRETFRLGADFIKMCVTGGVVSTHDKLSDTQFTVEEIAVAVEEASARGTYVTVHAHNNAGIRNAVLAGVKCVEHGSEIDEETAALMAQHGVAHVPTLAVVHALLEDAAAAGLPPEIRDRIGPALDGQVAGLRASRAAGVRVGSGSDLIGPAQGLRGKELTLRSEVETPMLALESATRVNADILGVGEETGTIEVGKLADLTAWATDPLADPTAFGDPDQVILVVQAGALVKDVRP
ncbi:amidohydrolase family protein [Ornithinimicrobium faecis]|uniref:Amidohydrolase family protein n=1 Tax=Ornithinimicrobium faecis TaxID=2934158 RepID=A0ABY4YYS4_9MICO|nr:amidohydrolase family protein [Ornithinimicrobium sp. HY1793]USQ81267.1 amidohydrolase family protein [Ornithinimicrobium sp. HY1793]